MKRKYPQYNSQGKRHLSGDYRFKSSYSDTLKPAIKHNVLMRRLKIAGLIIGAAIIVLFGYFLYCVIADLSQSAAACVDFGR